MKTIKAKVHRLPTENDSEAYVSERKEDGVLQFCNAKMPSCNPYWKPQHLYLTTDEEIKEGENHILVSNGNYYLNKLPGFIDDKCFKIIATTNPKLMHYSNNGRVGYSLPQIPQSFIEEYCKAGGIDEVLVEYWEGTVNKPKTDADNCIIIHPVEKEMYSRDEVGSKIKEFVKEYAYEWDMDDINEWIEENL